MQVSIGLPFYNSQHTLPDAIRSVFAQTFQDWELILVNDGSTDDSLRIAQSVNDPRVRVVSDSLNRGLAFRLNQLSHLARGTYLVRMDADDLMHPERLATQVAFLEANPTVDLVGSAVYTIDPASQVVGMRGTEPLDSRLAMVIKRGLFVHPTVTARTTWFRRNPYDDSLAYVRSEDLEFWCRTCQRSVFAKLAKPLLFYREGAALPSQRKNYLRNYLHSGRATRRIIRAYGPASVGSWPTLKLMSESYLKSLVFLACSAVDCQEVLFRKRNMPLNKGEQIAASKVLAALVQTVVPGLHEARPVNGTLCHSEA